MILGLVYSIVRSLLDLLVLCRKTEAALQIEVLALRHQLRVLERQVHRPRFQPADRLLLSALSRLLLRSAWRSFLVSPETLLRWHRELVRWKWALYARRLPRGRPSQSPERQDLIVRLARENPGWGYRRIQGELLKLGCRCSHGTVRNVLRHHGLLPAPRRGQRSWREFVRQHADQILAVDFFTVETVWLQRLHVLFFLEIGSRCVHLVGCTTSPTGAWVVQQARQLAWLLQNGQDPGPLPAPRSGLQVQRRLRRGLQERACGGHPAALPIASGELLRREMGWDSKARGPRKVRASTSSHCLRT